MRTGSSSMIFTWHALSYSGENTISTMATIVHIFPYELCRLQYVIKIVLNIIKINEATILKIILTFLYAVNICDPWQL